MFIIAVAVATYMVNPGTFSFEVFGINMPKLPIAVWVAIPVALLVIASIIHMMFYSTKNFFNIRKLKADAKRLEDGVYWSLINEPTSVNYANDDMKKSASILAESYITPNSLESADISFKIKEAAKVINKINKGEYVDLKSQKFAKHISDNNPIELKNNFNHLESDSAFALNVLDSKDKYSEDIVDAALDKVTLSEDFFTLKKYAKILGKDRFLTLLGRVEKGEDIGFDLNMLKSFISSNKLDCKEYHRAAKVALSNFEPDENLNLFKELKDESEEAMPAYLYLLFKCIESSKCSILILATLF